MKKTIFLLPCLLIFSISCDNPKPVVPPTPTPQAQAALPTAVFTPTETPEPPEYVVDDMKGTVLIIEEGGTEAVPAEEEETVSGGDQVITKDDSEATLTLNPDTMFRLGPNSRVTVDQLVANSTNGFISRLKLWQGKVLSEVEKLQESHSTFEVESGGVVCGVRGTAFEVQKKGDDVHTSTFHGVVEMKKGTQVQTVGENQHLAFSARKNDFMPKRKLNPVERSGYRKWLKKKAVVQKRAVERQTLLASTRNMSPADKADLNKRMGQVKPKDRMRAMKRAIQEKKGGAVAQEPSRGPSKHENTRGKDRTKIPEQKQYKQPARNKGLRDGRGLKQARQRADQRRNLQHQQANSGMNGADKKTGIQQPQRREKLNQPQNRQQRPAAHIAQQNKVLRPPAKGPQLHPVKPNGQRGKQQNNNGKKNGKKDEKKKNP
jgi:hypothetical protein